MEYTGRLSSSPSSGSFTDLSSGGNIFRVAVEGENVVDRTGFGCNVKVREPRRRYCRDTWSGWWDRRGWWGHADLFSSFVEKIVIGELILHHLFTVHPYGECTSAHLYGIACPGALLEIVLGGSENFDLTGYKGKASRSAMLRRETSNATCFLEAVAHLVSSRIRG